MQTFLLTPPTSHTPHPSFSPYPPKLNFIREMFHCVSVCMPWWSDDLFNTQIPTMENTHFLAVPHAVQNRNKYVTDTTTSGSFHNEVTTTTTEQPKPCWEGWCERGIRGWR